MPAALDALQKIHSNGKGKGKAVIEDEQDATRPKSKARKDKVLMLCSRGVTQRMRHLLRDLEVLLPHTKKGPPAARLLVVPTDDIRLET